ncbi:MAG TPA: hypothetical protein VJ746_11740 [Nitrospira sp.]|nr:hypothetical protein [Nitrospira sp.]
MSVRHFDITQGGILIALVMLCEIGCTNREFTRTPRTGTEQLLLSHALEQSMKALEPPSPPPATVAVDIVGFVGQRQIFQPNMLSNGPMINNNTTVTTGSPAPEANPPTVRPLGSDLIVMQGFIEGRLADLGYAVVDRREDADLWIRVIVLALGTDQGQSFFGMPAIQSTVIPFSTPALTIYEAQRQIAYVRYRLQVYDARAKTWHVPSPWYDGSAYYNQYTLFFFINFRGTDIQDVPQLQ